eukprot:4438778-Amphidinium_carterae.1
MGATTPGGRCQKSVLLLRIDITYTISQVSWRMDFVLEALQEGGLLQINPRQVKKTFVEGGSKFVKATALRCGLGGLDGRAMTRQARTILVTPTFILKTVDLCFRPLCQEISATCGGTWTGENAWMQLWSA